MCIPHFFSLPNGVRRSTQAWLQNLAHFQVFINTSVIQDIQDKTLTIYINFGKFKLEKAPNFVTRPASNVERRTPFGSENWKCGMHISVKCVVIKVCYCNTLLRISLICAFRIFSRFRTAFDGRRSTQAWLQNLAPFQVFINTSVIQDKTLTIYINFGKFKLEKAPNFVTRPASNVDRRTPFGSEKKFGMYISVKCVVMWN